MACSCRCQLPRAATLWTAVASHRFGMDGDAIVKRWQATALQSGLERVGELRGVIYRTSRVPGEPPKNYVHFFKDDKLPTLITNHSGTRLYIVGGNYRVTNTGIHG